MKLRNKKTGEVFESFKGGPIDLYFYSNKPEGEDVVNRNSYLSLAELNADWEDYEPAEPLIKDEKIRKAIRSWYEALPLDDLHDKRILFNNGYFCVGIYRIDCGNYVVLKGIKERFYTINELCGEEEE